MADIQIEIHPEPFSRPFKILDLGVIEDRNLSYAAKGLHTYLVSRPPGWKTWEKDLIARSTNGRDSVRSKIKELEEAGYLKREQIRNSGKFAAVKFNVYLTPHRGLENRQRETQPHNNITTLNIKQKRNTSYSVGNTLRSQKNSPLNSENKDTLTLKIYPRKKNNKPSASKGKFFDSDFESGSISLSDYYLEKGFGKSDYSPLVYNKYLQLKKKGIPVDTESLISLVDKWNGYLDKNGEKIKLRKGISLNKHTLDQNLTLLHLQSTITYMTKVKGFSIEEMTSGIENFLGLYLNGHSYNTKANLVDALTNREETFLKCINGSIKKMPNFYPKPKERKDLKYFIKKCLRELDRDASEEDERFARGYEARGEYRSYLEKTDLTIEEIEKKIAEEVKLLKGE